MDKIITWVGREGEREGRRRVNFTNNNDSSSNSGGSDAN
jgi:hypothetical protein